MRYFLVFLFSSMLATAACAQGDLSTVEIKSQPVAGGVHMLMGSGGNIAVSTGADGVIMIDDQFAPLSDKIRAAVATISKEPIRFLINTHWHFDHTGGNENFGKSGSLIVAHHNVRKRMSTDQFIEFFKKKVPSAPKEALPVITYSEQASFHLNGDEIRLVHVAHAHTDGDTLIHFAKSNVIHMGDTFFNGLYPFIDLASGGSIQGMIAAAEYALSIADDKTRIIPGHGALTDKKGLQAYRDMLVSVRDKTALLIKQGKSLEEVVAAKPSAEYDAALGGAMINPPQLIGFVFSSLKTPPESVGVFGGK